MQIALDVDGVLADVIQAWIRLYNSKHGKRISKSQITSWDFWQQLGITRSEFYDTLSMAWSEWEQVPPTEKDLASRVDALSQIGEVDILTGRSRDTLGFVKGWLKTHGVRYRRFVAVPRGKRKSHFHYDVYIDDAPNNALEISGSGRHVTLYDQPWNRGIAENLLIHRVKGLGHAALVISRLGGKENLIPTALQFHD